MKLAAPALALAFAAFLHVPALAQEPAQALDAFHAALVAGDKAKVHELLDPQVAIYESGKVERSLEEYASSHMAGDMEFASTAKRKVLSQQVRKAGDVATIWSETETEATARGKPVTLMGFETAVLEKKAGKWRIVHIHWSARRVY